MSPVYPGNNMIYCARKKVIDEEQVVTMNNNSFFDILNHLVGKSRKSKNILVAETGIDRSTFFKILAGKRIPTEKQFGTILRALLSDDPCFIPSAFPERVYGSFLPADIDKLLKEYVRIRTTPLSFQYWTAARNFIKTACLTQEANLQDTPDYDPDYADTLKITRDFIHRQLCMDHGSLDFHISPDLLNRLPLNRLFSIFSNTEVPVRQIISISAADHSPESADTILQNLAKLLTFLEHNAKRFLIYEIAGSSHGNKVPLYPNYLIGRQEMLLIDASGTVCINIKDETVIAASEKIFEDKIRNLKPLFSSPENFMELASMLQTYYQNFGNGSMIFASERPCALQLVTQGMIDHHLSDPLFSAFAKRYTHTLQGIENFSGLMSPDGLAAFESDHCISEAGMDFHLSESDMTVINQRIQDMLGTRMYLIPFSCSFIPGWEIALFNLNDVLLSLHDSTNCIIHFQNRNVAQTLHIYYDFMRKIFAK